MATGVYSGIVGFGKELINFSFGNDPYELIRPVIFTPTIVKEETVIIIQPSRPQEGQLYPRGVHENNR